MNMNKVLDEMAEFLNHNWPGDSAEKGKTSHLATMRDIENGSTRQVNHLKWMIEEMYTMDDTEKLMRWIGFMQGALWGLGFASIDDFRSMNVGK